MNSLIHVKIVHMRRQFSKIMNVKLVTILPTLIRKKNNANHVLMGNYMILHNRNANVHYLVHILMDRTVKFVKNNSILIKLVIYVNLVQMILYITQTQKFVKNVLKKHLFLMEKFA